MILPDLSYESKLWSQNISAIVGIDEVGRGSWAGPLVAAGVILPEKFKIPKGLADSKLVSKNNRKKLSKILKKTCLGFYISEISVITINKIGIGAATQRAFRKISKKINPNPNFILTDAFHIKYLPKGKQIAIKHGDQKSASIAAASIIAKVYRDNLMERLAKDFPLYGFEKHKGYGTSQHQMAIKKYGLSSVHRINYNLKFLS